MNTMFSSFDLKFFFFQFFFYFMFFLFFPFFFYKFHSFKNLIYNIFSFLDSFFLSLKYLNFSKCMSFNFFFISFFIFFLNFLSVLSFSFPLTSQVGMILFLSLSFWISILFFSLKENFKGFFLHLIPEGSPLGLSFFLFLIEIVSNLIRPVTLTIRLVANILAGHLLMILLSNLVYKLFISGFFYLVLNLVEIFVSLIQSYIFSTMICLYYSEV